MNQSNHELYVGAIKDGSVANLIQNNKRIAGMGFSYASCGQFVTEGCVDSEAHKSYGYDSHVVVKKVFRCGRMSCPVCFDKAIDSIASKTSERVIAYAVLKKSSMYQNPKKRQFVNVVVSPSEKDFDKFADKKKMRNLTTKVTKVLKSVGFIGGAKLLHYWRWQLVNGVKDMTKGYFSPHWHFVGVGWINPVNDPEPSSDVGKIQLHDQLMILENNLVLYDKYFNSDYDGKLKILNDKFPSVKSIYEKTGLVVKVNGSYSDIGRVFRSFQYLLSHVAVEKDKAVSTYVPLFLFMVQLKAV